MIRRDCEWLFPALLAAAVLGVVLSSRPTLDGHEVLVAQTAREMIASGDFLHPTFAGEPRLQKPPLAYWTCALSFRLFGENETAARLPSALAAVIGVALTAIFARRAFGPGMGWLAGCVQATSLWTVAYGRLALVDAMLTTLISAAMLVAAWDRLGNRTDGRPWAWCIAPSFWTLCGLIALAKGPVGLAMLWPPVILYRWMRGKRETDASLLFHRSSIIGVALFLVLSLAWPVAMLERYPEAWEVWTGQSLGRFQEHWGPQTRPWWYFFVQTPWLLFPWSVPLVIAAVRRPRIDLTDPHRLLLVAWFATVFLLCTLSAGKRAHYILPGLPAACIFAALAVPRLSWRAPSVSGGRLTTSWARVFRGVRLPTLTLPARPLVLLIALVEAVVYAAVVAPGQDMTGFRRMVERNQARLQQSSVVQVGSRERATVFPVNRPMQWLAEPPASVAEPTLVLTPEKNLPEVLASGRAKVIDSAGPKRSRVERSPGGAFALVELEPVRR